MKFILDPAAGRNSMPSDVCPSHSGSSYLGTRRKRTQPTMGMFPSWTFLTRVPGRGPSRVVRAYLGHNTSVQGRKWSYALDCRAVHGLPYPYLEAEQSGSVLRPA